MKKINKFFKLIKDFLSVNKINLKQALFVVLIFCGVIFLVTTCNSCCTAKKLKKEVSELSFENDKLSQNNKALTTQILELKQNLKTLETENKKFQKSNENLSSEIKSLNSQNLELKKTIRILKQTTKSIDERFTELLNRLENQILRLENLNDLD